VGGEFGEEVGGETDCPVDAHVTKRDVAKTSARVHPDAECSIDCLTGEGSRRAVERSVQVLPLQLPVDVGATGGLEGKVDPLRIPVEAEPKQELVYYLGAAAIESLQFEGSSSDINHVPANDTPRREEPENGLPVGGSSDWDADEKPHLHKAGAYVAGHDAGPFAAGQYRDRFRALEVSVGRKIRRPNDGHRRATDC
jgi:hypothetical protein